MTRQPHSDFRPSPALPHTAPQAQEHTAGQEEKLDSGRSTPNHPGISTISKEGFLGINCSSLLLPLPLFLCRIPFQPSLSSFLTSRATLAFPAQNLDTPGAPSQPAPIPDQDLPRVPSSSTGTPPQHELAAELSPSHKLWPELLIPNPSG